jgi:ketosteroid isomerase-like protein
LSRFSKRYIEFYPDYQSESPSPDWRDRRAQIVADDPPVWPDPGWRRMMAVDLPEAIAAYFAADKEQGAAAVARCFTEDAVVRDEGKTYVGRTAIRQWKAEASRTWRYTADPVSIVRDGERMVVTSHLVGDFPGSPVDLRYIFVLDSGQIAALEIKP